MSFIIAADPPTPSDSPAGGRRKSESVRRRPALASITPSGTPKSNPPESTITRSSVYTTTTSSNSNVAERGSSRFPTAVIDVESLDDVMAARLTTCLLGHVLFLKGQIPFPVAQLPKMSLAKKTDARANKKLDALLASFDLLSSHLGSTFTALAAALTSKRSGFGTAVGHVAIVLGPSGTSASAARARVLLELEGLRVVSPNTVNVRDQPTLAVNGHLKENTKISRFEKAETPDRPRLLSTINVQQPNSLLEDADACSDEGEDIDDDNVEDVPESDSDSSDSSSEIDSEEEDSSVDTGKAEVDLCAAERLLSRTLAIANADPALGMAADIRPTLTHILLRAPRRFSHPAWIPRQNLPRDMDPLLREFELEFDEPVGRPVSSPEPRSDSLNDITNTSRPHVTGNSLLGKATANGKRKGCGGGVKTDYVRVRCRGAISDRSSHYSNVPQEKDGAERDKDNDGEDEDEDEDGDEMIWWSWDGKLEGFADW